MNKKLLNGFLMEEFDDGMNGNGGGGEHVDPSIATEGELTPATEGGGNNQQAQNIQLDASFADRLGASIAKSLPQRQEPQKEISEAELEKLTHRYRVPEATVTALFGEAPEGVDKAKWIAQKLSGLQEIVDGAGKHAITVANLKFGMDLEKLSARYEPVLRDVNERALNGFYDQLSIADEELKGLEKPQARELLSTAVGMLQQSGYRTTGNAIEDGKAIVQKAKQIIASVRGNQGGNSNGNSNGHQQSQNANGGGRGGLPRSLNGAGGSGAGSGQNKGQKQGWELLKF